MKRFYINGYLWTLLFIDPYDEELVDRTGSLRVATTDPRTHTIYLSQSLQGDFLRTVFLHELGHAIMISYGLLEELHRMVIPKYWIECEEWICNFLSDYGPIIFQLAEG